MTPSRSEQDPTRQGGNVKRAKAAIAKRVRNARPEVLALLDAIPVRAVTTNASYVYELDAQRYLQITEEIDRILARWLDIEATTGKPVRWFFDTYTGSAYDMGAQDAAAAIAGQLPPDMPPYSAELYSPAYQRRIQLVFARTFNDMKGFSGQAAEDLARTLANGVAAGDSPRTIARGMRDVFDQVEGYRALRIARTEINKAYTDARTEQTQDARDRLGLDIRLLHVSALVDATRASHAARHAHIYTPDEQRKWWDTGTNRINCLCSTVEVVYIDGEPVNSKLIEKYRARGAAFFSSGGS